MVDLKHRIKKRNHSGQGLLEYILLMALISVVSIGIVKFLLSDVYGVGFGALPDEVKEATRH